ncbi:hypothetical protein N8Z08_02270 [bacterium]|nr:hypothetical protein [bacterium]
MKSALLNKLKNRKRGWKPQPIHDDNGLIRNACMVSNGIISVKVEVPVLENLNEMDNLLEVQAIKAIRELETRDNAIIKRNTLIFSTLASAAVVQAESFKGLIHQDGKHELNKYVNYSEKLVKTLQKDFIEMGGEQMEVMLIELKEITLRLFNVFGTAIDLGEVQEFIEYSEAYVKPTDTPVVEMKPVAKKKPTAKKKAVAKKKAPAKKKK